MNEHELQQLTMEISRTSFHREFTHKITYKVSIILTVRN